MKYDYIKVEYASRGTWNFSESTSQIKLIVTYSVYEI